MSIMMKSTSVWSKESVISVCLNSTHCSSPFFFMFFCAFRRNSSRFSYEYTFPAGRTKFAKAVVNAPLPQPTSMTLAPGNMEFFINNKPISLG